MPDPSHPAADAVAAATWERLRDHTAPARFTAAVADLLVARLDLRRPIADVGTGSGQLAAALALRGAHAVTVDLSVPMLERVPAGLRRVAADATSLPLRRAAVGAAIAAHLLHVVPRWRAAVLELDRIVGPDGVVLVQVAASSATSHGSRQLRTVFGEHLPAGALAGNEVAADPAALDQPFVALGRSAIDLPEVRMPRQETVRGVLRWLQGNPWTWPGPSSGADRARAAEATAAWALAQGTDLDEPFATASVNRWRLYGPG